MAALLADMAADHPGRAVLVVSNVAGAGGLALASARGVPVAVVEHRGRSREAFEADLAARLQAARPDVVCLAGFMRVLSPALVAEWAGRMINIHPSLLPKYPGLHTHARALAAGDDEAGCTVHEVTAALDAGPLLGQARVPVLPGDTEASLAARVLAAEHRLYPAVLRRYVTGNRAPLFL